MMPTFYQASSRSGGQRTDYKTATPLKTLMMNRAQHRSVHSKKR